MGNKLVGPDCRKLLANFDAILASIRQAITEFQQSDADGVDFEERHGRVLAALAVVSSGTRRVTGKGTNGLLSELEKDELKAACAAFGQAWRESYKRPLTPKGHTVVVHVPWFVDAYGICGIFGEDGCESLHVSDSLCRRKVRVMRNPEARHKAHTRHHLALSITPPLDQTVHS